ncbi:MAG: rhamnulose-1-phosphate aldolase [Dysgonamonadaceae bacterium]|jgi:rhamnulose-1-phosphate aldolase|nr:rhamnulose-1-phosphate aldolase [Dysgonamonadaceae bacterium]
MNIIRTNVALMHEIDKISEVAGYLWEKGWAERNGGNISVNVTECITNEIKSLPSLVPAIPLPLQFDYLRGNYFYVTGTGKRMRYVAKAPFEHGSIIRINDEGNAYGIVAENPVMPTSELPSHLSMHNYMREIGKGIQVVLHTHPTDLIALSHSKKFLEEGAMARILWSMIPESRIVVPRGIGIIPYEIPGTLELAAATIRQLDKHDVVLWEKHGVLCVGDDIVETFDAIDTLSKSAQIYLTARQAGFDPQGMTDEQLDALVPVFNLPV